MSQETSPRASLLTVIAVIALVGAGAWLWLSEPSQRGTPNAIEAPPVTSQPLSRPSLKAELLRAIAPTAGSINVSETVLMPDGTRLRSLNRVLNPPAIKWPTERPYSPVTGTTFDQRGYEWYVHADGSTSTVFMMFRSDIRREDATAVVYNPIAALPMDPTSTGDVPKK